MDGDGAANVPEPKPPGPVVGTGPSERSLGVAGNLTQGKTRPGKTRQDVKCGRWVPLALPGPGLWIVEGGGVVVV